METLAKKGCCGNHSHDHKHGHEGCCGAHKHVDAVVQSQPAEADTCGCGEKSSGDDGEDGPEHSSVVEISTSNTSGCGCGCDVTMKDIFAERDSARQKRMLEHAQKAAEDHSHEHHGHSHGDCCDHEHDHSHDHSHDDGCGCGHDHDHHELSPMAKVLAALGFEPAHDHSHDHGEEGCGCGHDHAAVNVDHLALALLSFFIGIGAEKLDVSIAGLSSSWVVIILMMISYLLAGHKTILIAFKNITKGEIFDENFLMTIATAGAIGIGEFPEAAAVMLFYQVGEYFQGRAVARSRRSISELMDIRPDFANKKENGSIKVVSPESLRVGDLIVIKSGEKVPVDCVIVDGRTTIDSSALTGESIPVEKTTDEKLLSGSINLTGLVTARVEKEFGESTVSKILELVQNASEKKSEQERFITRFARYYTPIVVLLAVLITAIPPLFFEEPFAKWFARALIFLVISCPCALVISVPLSFFAGIGGASKKGVLFKGSSYVEQLSQVQSILFDKTGTLTKGTFEVAEISPANGISPDELLEIAAYAESNSNHPIAKSIVRSYQRKGADFDSARISSVEEISGNGVRAILDGKTILAGNARLMASEGITAPAVESTAVYLAQDAKYIGCITIEDALKTDATEAIAKLNKMGIETTILTGDNQGIAQKVASQLGVSRFFAELLPQNKVEKTEEELKRFENSSGRVAFVGDGINDAPVLARADVGIAMGGIGSDAAIEAADVVIMTDEPSKIADAIAISKKTISVATQNIWFALGVKVIVMVLGVVGIANMWLAVFADVGVSFLAILNAMRAYRVE